MNSLFYTAFFAIHRALDLEKTTSREHADWARDSDLLVEKVAVVVIRREQQ